MGITDERISYKGGETSYRVVIDNFETKMHHWNHGRQVHCKYFWHDDVKFKLSIYPNGNERSSQGYVSVFLHNESEKDVWADFTISMSKEEAKFETSNIAENSNWGQPKFFDHDDVRDSDEDDDLAITVTIKRVWKEFAENELSNQSVSRGVKKIQSVSIPQMQKELMKANKNLQTNMSSVLSRLQSLETKFSQMQTEKGGASGANWKNVPQADRGLMIPKPECPVCFEEMNTETKIGQCLSGHYLCWKCKSRVQECPSCKLPVDGRAIGMEQYIKTLFK